MPTVGLLASLAYALGLSMAAELRAKKATLATQA
jgi:hypothetical protein